jgi:hypothetical protein
MSRLTRWGMATLLWGVAPKADNLANYSPQTLPFGPTGQRTDLEVNFRAPFVDAINERVKDPISIFWLREDGYCRDSEPNCSLASRREPHCRLQVEPEDTFGKSILESKKTYAPWVAVDFEIRSKVDSGNLRHYGEHNFHWVYKDPKGRLKLDLQCHPAQGRPPEEFTKNMFTRVIGLVMEARYIMQDPDEEENLPSIRFNEVSNTPKKSVHSSPGQ